MRRILGRRAGRLAVAVIVLGLVGGAVAYAAIPDGGGVIHACYKKNLPNQGALRVIDTAKSQDCSSSELPLTWNQRGPSGPSGATGPSGDSGPSGPSGSSGPAGASGPSGAPGYHPVIRWSFDIPAGDFLSIGSYDSSTVFPPGTKLEGVSGQITGISDVPAGCVKFDLTIGTDPNVGYLMFFGQVDVAGSLPVADDGSYVGVQHGLTGTGQLATSGICWDSGDNPIAGFPHVTGTATVNVIEAPFDIQ